ncbi:copper chaperone PCu(A)C [Kingella negevensis]|uniref:copper chaperone PCu(A)C n=1 Tax=Kingella negevensis TaxID=1522312 RepID=UPI00050A2218|nr:copper chaperone PCu(A)C [Kingella negevensis]MDK4685040.1 copper chaperone PCu(A)C [Kingella negevensis]MDK4689636.1 copper chaperone PCu(A)C [Kingella negevensis]MDK4707549.1 copper chaperone PCu(A)C [Kingella negevensis]MDK4709975.1 copper chaperone PCu(A)C [Kingella negevensis]WII91808.1 copper chaperone PCu(A)C [Kingella negevensis]
MKKTVFTLAAALLCNMAMAQGIETSEVYARPTVEGMHASGVFLNFNNTDKQNDKLIGAEVDAKLATAQIHNHINENGVMKMREVKGGVDLPAGQTQAFQPGSYHIMLMNLQKTLKVGDTFPLTLKFERNKPQTVTVTVKEMGHMAGHQHGKHEHKH